MSGHNKWSKIKNRKAITDAKKSKVFTKMARLIAVESKKCKGDTNSPGLRHAMEKARGVNMPSDNIDRAVKKGAGGGEGDMYSVLYEAYGPGGCAIMIEGLTDNKNRTGQEVKHILSKNGLALAVTGSASWAFTKTSDGWVPQTTVPLSPIDSEALARIVEELEDNDDVQDVSTNEEGDASEGDTDAL